MGPSDSKDFLDQIRTVHFTLLVVCLAAVVIVSSPSPTRFSKALEQLDSIITVTKPENWKTDIVEAAAEALAKGHPQCKDEEALDMNMNSSPSKVNIKREWDVEYTAPATYDSPDVTTPPNIAVPQDLEHFKAIWESSGKLYCPSTKGFKLQLPNKGKLYVWYVPDNRLENYSDSYFEASSESGKQQPRNFKWVITKHLPPAKDEDKNIKERPPAALIQVSNDVKQYVIPTEFEWKSFNDIEVRSRIKIPGDKWKLKKFDEAFPELNQIATGQELSSLSFDHAKRRLESLEDTEKHAEAFEAFGIKFPLEATTRWAVFLILGIQAYLWLHLDEYSRRNLPKGDVAWIGVYSGCFAKFLSAFTMLIIPVSVILFLCIEQGLALQVPVSIKVFGFDVPPKILGFMLSNKTIGFVAWLASAVLSFFTARVLWRVSVSSQKTS